MSPPHIPLPLSPFYLTRMSSASVLSSAVPLLAMLEDPDVDMQEVALQKLDEGVNQYWPEIAPVVSKLYVLPPPTSQPVNESRISSIPVLSSLLLSRIISSSASLSSPRPALPQRATERTARLPPPRARLLPRLQDLLPPPVPRRGSAVGARGRAALRPFRVV